MKFLFVASGRKTPSTRFRIEPFLPAIRQAGHRCDVAYSFPEKYEYFPWMGWRISQSLKRCVRHLHVMRAKWVRYDAIVIEREVFDDDSSNIEFELRKATDRLVLDVDDAVFLRHPEKFDRIAEICDVGIAGNSALAEYMMTRCREVVQIPTCVRLSDYPAKNWDAKPGKPVIGWIGTTPNVAFLNDVATALRNLSARVPFRLLVVAGTNAHLRDIDLSGVDVEFRPWHPRRDVADVLEMDIGLMPLPADQQWMRYKCGLKLIQYLAVGIPAVASPIGVNSRIIVDDVTGFLASNDTQWQASLETLLLDVDRRRRLGANGRRLVEQEFSIEANVNKLLSVLSGHDVNQASKTIAS